MPKRAKKRAPRCYVVKSGKDLHFIGQKNNVNNGTKKVASLKLKVIKTKPCKVVLTRTNYEEAQKLMKQLRNADKVAEEEKEEEDDVKEVSVIDLDQLPDSEDDDVMEFVNLVSPEKPRTRGHKKEILKRYFSERTADASLDNIADFVGEFNIPEGYLEKEFEEIDANSPEFRNLLDEVYSLCVNPN